MHFYLVAEDNSRTNLPQFIIVTNHLEKAPPENLSMLTMSIK